MNFALLLYLWGVFLLKSISFCWNIGFLDSPKKNRIASDSHSNLSATKDNRASESKQKNG